MKRVLLTLFVFALVFISTGCGSSNKGIVGTWGDSEGNNVTITFKEGGSGTTEYKGEYYDDFLYTYKDEILTLKYQTVMETELKYKCIIKDDVMTLKDGSVVVGEYKRLK